VFSAMLVTLLWADLRNPYLWFVSLVFVGYAVVGFLDDWLKITK
jgi:phospho-N-acetylmuramoyl-pentapeptide-transferase